MIDRFRLAGPAGMSAWVRANYAHEIRSSLLLSFMLTGVETGVASVLVRNAFDGLAPDTTLNFVVAIVGASKALANIFSFVWVRVNHGRDKIAFTSGLQWAMAAMIVLLACVPRSEAGLWMFAAGIMIARVIWSGYITVRSTVWSANYPRAIRAKLTGNFATVQVIVVGLLGIGIGEAMDWDERSFRVLFVAGVVIGAIGIRQWRKIRVRGHRRLMADERSTDEASSPSFNPLRSFRVLREDRAFSGYMACMFLLGTGNLMVPPLMAIVVKERFGMGYLAGMLVTSSIPYLMMPLAIPWWSSLLSRLHVVRFRVYHAWVFALANGLFFLAAWRVEPWLLFVASAVQGAAFAGGALAWTLGHLDFAPAHRASSYMGVHVTLTGVRGLISPFVGVWLYEVLEVVRPASGSLVFAVATGMCVIGAMGFLGLSVRMGLRRKVHGEIEQVPPAREGV